jgi:hypothetical protein
MLYRPTRSSAVAPSSVVDINLQVVGTDGLHVCDTSVIPFSSAANPVRALAALALQLSRHSDVVAWRRDGMDEDLPIEAIGLGAHRRADVPAQLVDAIRPPSSNACGPTLRVCGLARSHSRAATVTGRPRL